MLSKILEPGEELPLYNRKKEATHEIVFKKLNVESEYRHATYIYLCTHTLRTVSNIFPIHDTQAVRVYSLQVREWLLNYNTRRAAVECYIRGRRRFLSLSTDSSSSPSFSRSLYSRVGARALIEAYPCLSAIEAGGRGLRRQSGHSKHCFFFLYFCCRAGDV